MKCVNIAHLGSEITIYLVTPRRKTRDTTTSHLKIVVMESIFVPDLGLQYTLRD